jgi:ankyrin repeat protein
MSSMRSCSKEEEEEDDVDEDEDEDDDDERDIPERDLEFLRFVMKRNYKKANEYISEGMNLNFRGQYGQTPLYAAAEKGDLTMARLLIKGGAKVDFLSKFDVDCHFQPKLPAICGAISANHMKMVKYLAEIGSNVNVSNLDIDNERCFTPLTLACIEGDFEMVKFLVEECHAYVNMEDDEGFYPLQRTAINGSLQIAAYMLNKGAKIENTDSENESSLDIAVSQGKLEMVKFLCWRGGRIRNDINEYFHLRNSSALEYQPNILYLKKDLSRRTLLALMSAKTVARLGLDSPIKLLDSYLLRALFRQLEMVH